MIKIKQATSEDIPVIKKLAYDIWPGTFAKILSEEQISYMLELMYSLDSLEDQFQKGHRFILVSDNNTQVGFAGYEMNYKNLPKTKIHKIYVTHNTQGKGVGRKIIEHFSHIASKHQNHTLVLNVNRFNPAVKFYKKIGFTIINTEDINIGNGFLMEDFVMEKTIHNSNSNL